MTIAYGLTAGLGHCVLQGRRARLGPNRGAVFCILLMCLQIVVFSDRDGCFERVLTSFLLVLQVYSSISWEAVGGVHMLLLLKGWMANLYPARACASKGLCDRSWCLYIYIV